MVKQVLSILNVRIFFYFSFTAVPIFLQAPQRVGNFTPAVATARKKSHVNEGKGF